MNMTSSSLQFEVAYWLTMTLGGAAQVAAAHCPKEYYIIFTSILAVAVVVTSPSGSADMVRQMRWIDKEFHQIQRNPETHLWCQLLSLKWRWRCADDTGSSNAWRLREPGRQDVRIKLGGIVERDMESFGLSCEDAQDRDHWRVKIWVTGKTSGM